MKKNKFIKVILIIPLLFSLILSGCWDAHELNELSIILGVGIDKEPSGLNVTLQVEKPMPAKASGGGAEAEPYFMVQKSGDTMVDVYNTLSQYHSRNMFFPDNQVIVFGEELAKEGVSDCLDFFLRDYESRPDTPIMIAKGNAYDILNTPTVLERIPSINLFKSILKQKENSLTFNSELLEFIVQVHNPTTAATAPVVEIVKDEIKEKVKFSGLAVFKKDKMVGMLNSMDSRGLLWVLQEIDRTSLKIDEPSGKTQIVSIAPTSDVKVNLDSKGKMSVTINISQTGVVEEFIGYNNYKTSEILNLLEEKASDYVREEILSSIRKAKELNCDYFGFGELFYKKYPKQWQQTLQPQWDTFFPHLNITVNVKSTIRGNGKVPLIYEQKGRHLGE